MDRDRDDGLIYLADTINGIVWATFWFRLIAFAAYIVLLFGFIWWTT